jgi:hypothetical protein
MSVFTRLQSPCDLDHVAISFSIVLGAGFEAVLLKRFFNKQFTSRWK